MLTGAQSGGEEVVAESLPEMKGKTGEVADDFETSRR